MSYEPSVAFAYPDESEEIRAEANRKAVEMTKDAVAFVVGIVAKSRTGRAALLKLAVVDSLFGGSETSHEIARRFRVSPRIVQRLRKELREEFFGRMFVGRDSLNR